MCFVPSCIVFTVWKCRYADFIGAVGMAESAVAEELAGILEECKLAVAGEAGHLNLDFDDGKSSGWLELQRKIAAKSLRFSTSQLLLRLFETDSTMLNAALLDVVMSAYTATLSDSDQCMFEIIRRAEQVNPELGSGVSFSCFGRAAERQQAHRAKQGVSVAPSQPTLREFVDSLDGGMIGRTVTDFPIRLPLNGSLVNQLFVAENVYDPR